MAVNGTLALRSMIAAAAMILIGPPIVFVSSCNAQVQLQDRAQARTVRVGFYENEPKIFTSETGQPSGIFIGILEDIARREQWDLVYVPCEWSECLTALEEGRIDLMPDVAYSAERGARFDFGKVEVVGSWSQVYASRKKPMSTLSDLNGRRLALLRGSIQQTVLEQLLNGLGYRVSIVEADSYGEAFALVAEGAADAVVSNQLFGNYHHQEYGLATTRIVFNAVPLHFATAHGANADLLEAIDRDLLIMKSEPGSAFYRELARWMERPVKGVMPRYLSWTVGGVGGFLGLAFVVILALRRQVSRNTKRLVEANETLRESRELLHGVFDAIPVRVFWKDRNLLFRGCNAAFARDAGFEKPEDLIGKDDHAICWWEQADLYQANDRAVIERGEAKLLIEETQRTPSGECIHLLTSKVPLRAADGTVVGLLGTYLDITRRVELEARLRQSEKMETVGRLAGGIAHDFNNLLTVINGTAELAARGLRDDDRLHEQLANILSAGERAADLTRQLLAFSRRQVLQPVVLNLNKTVTEIEQVLRRLIGEDIAVGTELAADLGNVRIDPTQVEQILLNLASNARDAMPDGGTLTIETANVMMDAAQAKSHPSVQPGPHVMLAVSDTGHGMDEATQRRVFEPFFTTRALGRGTGLGLATVYGIVKQCGGSIWVYSEVDKGTTIKIYLPRTEEPVRDAKPAPATSSGRGTETILVVEDEGAIRRLVRDVLEEHGYIVLDAENGRRALELLAGHVGSVQLLLTDVVMPDMGGRELADRLHGSHPGMKALFTSGYTDDAIVHHGVLDEGAHFIGKPYSVVELMRKVREVLDS